VSAQVAPADHERGVHFHLLGALDFCRWSRFCLDPKADISKGVWFFNDLLGALAELRNRLRDARPRYRGESTITQKIFETLDFWFSERAMVLIEGVAGIGRSASTRAGG